MNIPIEKIADRSKSLFTLVLAVARRANDISAGSSPLIKGGSKKVSTIALEEFKEGKVTFVDAPAEGPKA